MAPMSWPPTVLQLAKAISVAEGSNPSWNNPGDMTYAHGHPTKGTVNADGVLWFESAEDGWEALYHEVSLMLAGRSHIYSLTDTLITVGFKYSNGDRNWAVNVANYLGVSEDTTLQELASQQV